MDRTALSLSRMMSSMTSRVLALTRASQGAVVTSRGGGRASVGGSAVGSSGNDPATGARYFTLNYSILDGTDVLDGECE